jgi:hypothetical protein
MNTYKPPNNKAITFRREEIVFRQKLEIAQLDLQKSVQDKLKQLEVGSLKSKIQELEDVKAVGQVLWARIRWNQLGNMVSKDQVKI